MTLTTGTLRLATAGTPTTVIRYEILGAYGGYKLSDAIAAKTGTTANSMRDFAGYTHATNGRAYGSESIPGHSAYLYFNTNYSLMAVGATAVLVGTATSTPQSIKATRLSNGTAFIASNYVAATLYRRTKNTSNSWSTVTSWFTYTSQTYSAAFNTYDYWLDCYDGY